VKDLLKLTMMTIVDFANTSATEGDGTIFTDATGSRLTSARLTEFTDLVFALMEFIQTQHNTAGAAVILQNGVFTSQNGVSVEIPQAYISLTQQQQLDKVNITKVLLDNMRPSSETTAL
ncbi:MAG: hypothetical protein ACRC9T_08335, partial [Vibrionaceae bacterium]